MIRVRYVRYIFGGRRNLLMLVAFLIKLAIVFVIIVLVLFVGVAVCLSFIALFVNPPFSLRNSKSGCLCASQYFCASQQHYISK